MSKVNTKYKWGPRCVFLDEALAAHSFTGTEHAILLVVIRLTFMEPNFATGGRKESARISLDEFKRRTGKALNGIRKALNTLEKAEVLIVLRGPIGHKAKEYGINTRIDEWKVLRTGEIDEPKYPGRGCHHSGSLGCHHSGTLGTEGPCHHSGTHPATTVAPLDHHSGTLATSEPYSHKAPDAAQELLRDLKSKRESEASPAARSESKELALDIYRNLCEQWHPITSAPRTMLLACQDYARKYAHDLEAAWNAFDNAFAEALEYQEREGKTLRAPVKILDTAANILTKHGIFPREKDPT